ncbi:tetratricopeptide repeat protein [Vibrio hangzhouensis]|uniref:MSHA biogenesis protein MshN n=1 Tax=Vibrio hangzhouensis TaxID=462991 RepID=A0A1H5U600_9VIBR|nr:tetratricopeptide repeat protein [Vibrio hangzhouensis]SEF70456.1 MSHA biogenesis protein MshN [Vibrio hangzhouensis]
MSAINKALSELNNQQTAALSNIEQATIPKVHRVSPLLWMGVGASLSLAMGGWAYSTSTLNMSQDLQPNTMTEVEATAKVETTAPLVASPTTNMSSSATSAFELTKTRTMSTNAVETPDSATQPAQAIAEKPSPSMVPLQAEPISIAQVTTRSATKQDPAKSGEMVVEQVELSTEQLAEKAIQRAIKSIDANDINGALENYSDALRYDPTNEQVRQRLSALYYGKGQSRKAYELLQDGINRNLSGETLRIALSKLLIKENQQEAALTPLVHLPDNASIDYLSLRAGLAQRNKQSDIAYQSYAMLTQQDPQNARWWLGLAIQQERKMEFSGAKQSYQYALEKIGVSGQSKAFIRDRLKVIESIEGSQDAN